MTIVADARGLAEPLSGVRPRRRIEPSRPFDDALPGVRHASSVSSRLVLN